MILPKINEKSLNILKGILDGSLLTKEIVVKQMPFILFMVVLAIFYIGNNYHAEKLLLDGVKLQREIKELRAEAITLQSEIMYLKRATEVANLVKKHQLHLKELEKPPYIIEIKKEK